MIREIAIREYAMSADRLLSVFEPFELFHAAYAIGGWYKGVEMSRGDREWIYKRNKNLFSKIVNFYPQKSMLLYRLISLPRPSAKLIVGNIYKVKTANKRIQSWTTSRIYPEKFYAIVYKNSTNKKDKRFVYLTVSTKVKPEEILLTTEVATKFLFQCLKNASKIKEAGGVNFDKTVFTLSCKATLRRITTNFIREQKEVILEITGARKVRLEQIIFDPLREKEK